MNKVKREIIKGRIYLTIALALMCFSICFVAEYSHNYNGLIIRSIFCLAIIGIYLITNNTLKWLGVI